MSPIILFSSSSSSFVFIIEHRILKIKIATHFDCMPSHSHKHLYSEHPAARPPQHPQEREEAKAQRGAVNWPRSHSLTWISWRRSATAFTAAPVVLFFPKGNLSKSDLEVAMVHEGSAVLLLETRDTFTL